jgi:hypothetical protein
VKCIFESGKTEAYCTIAVNASTQLEDLIQEKKYVDVAKTLAVGLLYVFEHSRGSRSMQGRQGNLNDVQVLHCCYQNKSSVEAHS